MSGVDAPLEALVRAEMLRGWKSARMRRRSRLRDLAADRVEGRAAEAERSAAGALSRLRPPVLAAHSLHDAVTGADRRDGMAAALAWAGAR